MALDQETINAQLELLAAHRRTLAHLLTQQAQFSTGYLPAHIVNGIAEARAGIARVKTSLRAAATDVEDGPDDEAPSQLTSLQPQRTVSDLIGSDKRTVDSGGGDYAERDIDKRQGNFIGGGTVQGSMIDDNQGTVNVNYNYGTAPAPALHPRLRAPVVDFVGRSDEINQLVTALRTTSGSRATIRGLRGMGGIGKTELAFAVAHQLTDVFPDQILIELRGASNAITPAQALQTAIHAFEREAQLPDDLNELRNIYCSVLGGRRVLILADDAKDAAQVRPLLPPAGCGLLITSRNRFGLPGMTSLDLGTLPSGDAQKLILEVCPRIGEHTSKLARLCGYLPLALRLSASLLANSGRNVARYLNQLEAEQLKHLADPDAYDDAQASVEGALHLSYDTLEPSIQQGLCQLSVFPASFDLAAALAILQVDTDTEVLLDLLQRRSLLEWDTQLERYSLHDLVRAFAAVRLTYADEIQLRYAQYYQEVANQANVNCIEGGKHYLEGINLFNKERIHITTGWRFLLTRPNTLEVDRLRLGYFTSTDHIGPIRYDKQDEYFLLLESALSAAQRLDQRSIQCRILQLLGFIYGRYGEDHKARDCCEQSLVIAREVGDKRGEGAALRQLGSTYRRLDMAEQAITCHQQAYEIASAVKDQREQGFCLSELGNAYLHLNRLEESINFLEQGLKITQEIGERRSEMIAHRRMGIAYLKLGKFQKAVESAEQEYALALVVSNKFDVAKASYNLSRALEKQGNLEKAIELIQAVVDYDLQVGDADAENDAAHLEQLQQQLARKRKEATPREAT